MSDAIKKVNKNIYYILYMAAILKMAAILNFYKFWLMHLSI